MNTEKEIQEIKSILDTLLINSVKAEMREMAIKTVVFQMMEKLNPEDQTALKKFYFQYLRAASDALSGLREILYNPNRIQKELFALHEEIQYNLDQLDH